MKTVDRAPVYNFKDRLHMRNLSNGGPLERLSHDKSQSVEISAQTKDQPYKDVQIPFESVRKNLLINATKHLTIGLKEDLKKSPLHSKKLSAFK